MLLLLLGCDAAPPPGACDAAPGVGWENWAQGFFATRCGACHSPGAQDRHGAPEGVDFVTHEDVQRWRTSIERAVLEEHTMPLGGGLGDHDLQLLTVYLRCGP